MPFVLQHSFIMQLRELRKNYEKNAEIQLERTPQPHVISLFFGAKDIDTRRKQILFIEQWLALLNKSTDVSVIHSIEEWQQYIISLRLLVAVSMYVKSQIYGSYIVFTSTGTTSVLGSLLDQALGMNRVDNGMDDETRACCLFTARGYLREATPFAATSAPVHKAMSEREWIDFHRYILDQCDALDSKYKTAYPITSIMMPLLAKPIETAEYVKGYALRDMVSQSSEFLPMRYALSAMLGSCILVILGPTSTLAAMLFAGRLL
ncbi:MAG: hypothetical protein ACOYKA_07365 [Legionellaceae bacterium]